MLVECPHCKQWIEILELNCKIFRCGMYKNFKQIDPHMNKDGCDQLIKENKIFGCGKPFTVRQNKDEWIAVICEYI